MTSFDQLIFSNVLKCIYDTLHCHVCDHRALSTKEVTKRNRPAAVSDRSLSKDVISSLPNQDIASLFENAFVNFDMTRCTCLNISYILMRRLTKNLTFPSLLLIFLGSFAQNFVLESAKVEIELTVISSRCLIPTRTHPNLRPAVLHSTQF